MALRNLFHLSYQRAVVPDFYDFFNLFYEKFIDRETYIAQLFANTDMKKQVEMLMQSITFMTSFSATLEPTEELEYAARLHGKDRLNIPSDFYDIWLDCLLETVMEKDPEYNEQIDRAWRTVMAPGIEYFKSYCDR